MSIERMNQDICSRPSLDRGKSRLAMVMVMFGILSGAKLTFLGFVPMETEKTLAPLAARGISWR
ncbi:hypothetical protein MESS2_740031 [Mesorhizobium metallidurans STM 2683]|uniref:Uncharacterized protein n=1 Tax=Mesorhizobium metallidurans STM 2683 TaxID=1297569 RepID=M5ETV6_9HYPH|nr:hypothetical protein MESS2_740031 [Mesorhizobium metallidurans STM 2683]